MKKRSIFIVAIDTMERLRNKKPHLLLRIILFQATSAAKVIADI